MVKMHFCVDLNIGASVGGGSKIENCETKESLDSVKIQL